MESKRHQLIKAIAAYLLEEIVAGAEYNFTLAQVSRKKNNGAELKLPAVSILENFNPDREPDTIGGVVGTKHKYDQIYLLNGWADDTDQMLEAGDAAHMLMADVKRALGKLLVPRNQDGFFDGLATTLSIEPGVVRPPDEQSSLAYFWLRIKLEIVEKVGDPYWIRD